MSLPYSATVLVNWLPVICLPSPESPAKRMTACSRTSRLCLPAGTSETVDIAEPNPLYCETFVAKLFCVTGPSEWRGNRPLGRERFGVHSVGVGAGPPGTG